MRQKRIRSYINKKHQISIFYYVLGTELDNQNRQTFHNSLLQIKKSNTQKLNNLLVMSAGGREKLKREKCDIRGGKIFDVQLNITIKLPIQFFLAFLTFVNLTKKSMKPWPVLLSAQSICPCIEGSKVQFWSRTHTWIVGQIPSPVRAHLGGNQLMCVSQLDVPLPPFHCL